VWLFLLVVLIVAVLGATRLGWIASTVAAGGLLEAFGVLVVALAFASN